MKCTQNSSILSFNEFNKKTNPVFIFGVARSGTTLTYNIMKFHPQVLKLPQDTYFLTHFWNIRDKIPIKAQYKILLSTCELTNDRSKSSGDELKRDISLQKTLINLIKEGVPKKIFSFMAYTSYVRKVTNKNSAITWWAEKTNNHYSYYQILKNWFPLCKFIFCIRDPRAAITSALGAHKMQGNFSSSESDYCLNAAINWVMQNRIALEMKGTFKDDVFVSKYESFVEAPINHINSIWRFLELPEMNETELSEKIGSLGQIYISKTGIKRPTGIDIKSVARWKELLSPSDIMIIDDITKETAKNFDYELKSNKVSTILYMKRFPKDKFRMYIKRIIKIIFFKFFPLKFFKFLQAAILFKKDT